GQGERPVLTQNAVRTGVHPAGGSRRAVREVEPETPLLIEALNDFLRITAPPEPPPGWVETLDELGAGERQAIVLAHSLNCLLLIDEAAGRSTAERFGPEIAGAAGVLIRSRQAGLIASVRPFLEEMRQQGYWLTDRVLGDSLQLAGEANTGVIC